VAREEAGRALRGDEQGYRDVREFAGTIAQLRGEFDPLGGQLAAATQNNEIDAARRQAQKDRLQHQIDVVDLKKKLEEARKPSADDAEPTGSAEAEQPAGEEPPADAAPADEPAKEEPPAADAGGVGVSAGAAEAAADLALFGADKRPGVPDPDALVASRAQLTQVEAARDEMAWRDFIQGSLRERELDDTHDLRGYTLYTLKFDVVAQPGSRNDKLGKVVLELDTDESIVPPKQADGRVQLPPVRNDKHPHWPRWFEVYSLYRNWKNAFERDVQLEAVAVQRRLEQGTLSEAEAVAVAAALANVRPPADAPEELKQGIGLLSASLAGGKSAAGAPPRRSGRGSGSGTMPSAAPGGGLRSRWCNAAMRHWKASSRSAPRSSPAGSGTPTVARRSMRPTAPTTPAELIDADRCDPAFGRFVDTLQRLKLQQQRRAVTVGNQAWWATLWVGGKPQEKNAAYVYAVEPKEYAQNISDVAAVEKMTQFVLALKASLPQAGGAQVGGYLNDIRQSENRLHAILRRPLVVGSAMGSGASGGCWGRGSPSGAARGCSSSRPTCSTHSRRRWPCRRGSARWCSGALGSGATRANTACGPTPGGSASTSPRTPPR
jgi:hypothetical protein